MGIFKRLRAVLWVVGVRGGGMARLPPPMKASCPLPGAHPAISLAHRPVSIDEAKNGRTHARVPVTITPLCVCTCIRPSRRKCHLPPQQLLVLSLHMHLCKHSHAAARNVHRVSGFTRSLQVLQSIPSNTNKAPPPPSSCCCTMVSL